MSGTYFLFLFAAGSAVGFLSGLLGIGGGIIMFPLLYYLPPLLGLGPIPVKIITGLTMIQGFFASLSALIVYRRHRLVNRSLVVSLGGALFVSSLLGALLSDIFPDKILLFVFGLLALSAAVMMFMPRSSVRDDFTEDRVMFNKKSAAGIGLILGLFLGMVGQGGAFIIIPILLYVLKIPLRVAFGSMLGIGLFSTTAGLAGKIFSGHVPFLMSVSMLSGAVPFAQVGSVLGKKTDTRVLRWILASVIALAAIRIWAGLA